MNNKQNIGKTSAAELLNKGETIVWEKSNTLYMPRYYKMDQGKVFYTDTEHNFKWLESTSTIEDFTESFDYVTKSDYENIEKNNQLQEFLTEYANGKVTLADDGTVEKIEQLNQHFILTITYEVLTSDIVQYVTFKQHESYTQGDEYNELSDVFDYDNVFSVTMADNEVIKIEEKTNEKAGTNMTKLSIEQWAIILENVSSLEEEGEFGNEIEILQFDSSNEFVLAHGCELFEDGFKTEKEAMERLTEIENEVASL